MAPKHRLEEYVEWRFIGRLEAGQTIMIVVIGINFPRQTFSALWKQFQNS